MITFLELAEQSTLLEKSTFEFDSILNDLNSSNSNKLLKQR